MTSNSNRDPKSLRSARWFAPDDLRGFGHRSRLMQMGYAQEDWAGKPLIAIINTWSDINPCHSHFKQRVEDVKRGILQAGGFPRELPAIVRSTPSTASSASQMDLLAIPAFRTAASRRPKRSRAASASVALPSSVLTSAVTAAASTASVHARASAETSPATTA